jgi:serpin B
VGQGPLSQQAYAASLMDKINNSKDVDFSCANAVWNNSLLLGDMVNTEYVDYIRETFLAEYTVTDFNDKTCDEINGWIYDHTDKKIKNMIEDLDRDTVMVLVNAITFDGKWEEPYEKDNVKDGDFTAANGKVQKATFLNDTSYIYFETDKATGFIKNYKGGEYAFLAILPKDASVSANEFAKSFTSKDYEDFISSRTAEYTVYSKMPEFKSDFRFLMNDTVKNLGAGDIFEPGKADFSGIAGKPGDMYVSVVLHQTHIEVDANGTRASAATVVMMTKGASVDSVSNERYVNCDRPYLYAIVDTKTMCPVFIGTVNEV